MKTVLLFLAAVVVVTLAQFVWALILSPLGLVVFGAFSIVMIFILGKGE